jgi:hypothetical protein
VTIVDAHAPAGPYSLFFIPDSDPASMVRVMDRCGVARAVLSANLAIQLDVRAGNEATAAAATAFPDRLLGYITINPWQDPAVELARWSDDRRFFGVKLHPELHHYPLTGARYAPVWEFAESTGAPVLTHTWGGSGYNGVDMLETVAQAHPDAVILAGHAGATMPGYEAAIDVARRHPRVILEICGSFNHGEVISRMVGEVGPEQVVFGSDFPFIDLRFSLGRVLFARLSESDRAAVLGGTMTRLLDWRAARQHQ